MRSKLFEKLLEKRGITEEFLSPKYEDLSDPFSLPDMEKATERILAAIDKGEKILIYGDYDVDGVTATTVIKETLELVCKNNVAKNTSVILTMLPDRFLDGYGMSKRLAERAKEEEISLVITVDCGSNNADIIDELAESGIDVVVTDHHELNGDVPEKAVACVNPKREDCKIGKDESLRDLCGAGVAFLVARAFVKLQKIPEGQEKWLLDLAMIGTICDSMVMRGNNRIICYYGMIVLQKTRRLGLRELMRISGAKKIDTMAIGFMIGPRLNAAGRLETAEIAFNLLNTTSKAEAASLAKKLDELNSERKKQQNIAVHEIETKGITDDPVIVVSGAWNEGVIGIIAGRLIEKYMRPSFVLSEIEAALGSTANKEAGADEISTSDMRVLKGSGRSFGDFNLADALLECKDAIISGGGHAAACGLKLYKGKIGAFTEKINQYYRSLNLKGQKKYLEVEPDLKIGKLASLNVDFLKELQLLEPFGEGNPEPCFLLSDLNVLSVDKMGSDGKHLRILARDTEGTLFKLVAFYARDEWFEVKGGEKISAVVSLMANEWNGTVSVEGRILKITSSNSLQEVD